MEIELLEKISRLARMEMGDDELREMAGHVENVLTWVARLGDEQVLDAGPVPVPLSTCEDLRDDDGPWPPALEPGTLELGAPASREGWLEVASPSRPDEEEP